MIYQVVHKCLAQLTQPREGLDTCPKVSSEICKKIDAAAVRFVLIIASSGCYLLSGLLVGIV